MIEEKPILKGMLFIHTECKKGGNILGRTKKKKKKEDEFVEHERIPIFFNPWSPEPEFEEPERFNPWDRRKVRKYKRW